MANANRVPPANSTIDDSTKGIDSRRSRLVRPGVMNRHT
jgi:hypothetical protein